MVFVLQMQPDGSELRQSVATLAKLTSNSKRTILRALKALRDQGLIVRPEAASRTPGLADVYKLSPELRQLLGRSETEPAAASPIMHPDQVDIVQPDEEEEVDTFPDPSQW